MSSMTFLWFIHTSRISFSNDDDKGDVGLGVL